MAHLSEGTLRRMVDEPDAHNADAHHLETCADCQARFKSVASDAHTITTLLAAPALNVDVARAFERVRSAPAANSRFAFKLPVFRPSARPMMLAFAAAVAVVALLATVVAQDKNIFSPNTVTTVPVTVADMQALSELSAYGTVSWTTQPQFQLVTSAAEAQTLTGLKVPSVASLPPGVSSTITYGAMTQAVASFTFSADKAAASATKAGKPLPALPKGMDGAKLTVTVGPAVAEIFGNMKPPAQGSGGTEDTGNASTQGGNASIPVANLPQLVVAESSAPVATSTQVTVAQFEDYLSKQPGISPALKAALKGIKNPSTTLIIPIPIQYASSTTVKVQGVNGVALGDNTGVGSGVIWVKNGVVFAVAGLIKQKDAVDIANQLT